MSCHGTLDHQRENIINILISKVSSRYQLLQFYRSWNIVQSINNMCQLVFRVAELLPVVAYHSRDKVVGFCGVTGCEVCDNEWINGGRFRLLIITLRKSFGAQTKLTVLKCKTKCNTSFGYYDRKLV